MATINPKNTQGFFKNYADHMVQMGHDTTNKIMASHRRSSPGDNINLSEPPIRKGTLAMEIALWTSKAFNSDRPFSDRYDVTDEILGAAVMPLIQEVLGVIFLGVAIYETGCFLAIKTGVKTDDQAEHGREALISFGAAIVTLVNSYVYLILSLFNLVSRTLFTILDGYKAPEGDRFDGGDEIKLGSFYFQY